MSAFPFLSPEWVDAARAIRDEYADRLPPPPVAIRANVVITNAPFESSTVTAFVDTSAGQMVLDVGELTDPELTIKVDYPTAKALFVDRDQGAAMEAFISGRIVVDGDLAKVMALQAQQANPVADEMASRIKQITARD